MPKILIADDKNINCSMLFKKLNNAGIEHADIIIANSGNDAIAKGIDIKNDSVIAILDMNMKDGDGATAAAALRAHHKDNITIIIWSTGNPRNDQRLKELNVIFVDAVNADKVAAIDNQLQFIMSVYQRAKLPPLTIPPSTVTSTPTTPSLSATAIDFYPNPCGISTPRPTSPAKPSKKPAADDNKFNTNLPLIKDSGCCCCQCVCLCGVMQSIKKFICG